MTSRFRALLRPQLALVLLAVLVVALQGSLAYAFLAVPPTHPGAPVPAPANPASGVGAVLVPDQDSGVPTATVANGPTVTVEPAVAPQGPCAPGQASSTWWSQNVNVTISLFNANNTAPYLNQVSGYAQKIIVNIDTDKLHPGLYPIQQATMTVWAVGWNNNSLNSTLPNTPAVFSMVTNPFNETYATGQLNDFKFYPPGSHVYFNISLFQNVTTPFNWTSPCPYGQVAVVGTPPDSATTGIDQPTWMYETGDGWPSPYFAQDITVTANPNVFSSQIQPDPFQSVYFFLNSTKIGMPIGGPEGGARLYYTLYNQTGAHPGGASFCPENSTFMESCFGGIPFGIGPFYVVGNQISFQFEAFVSTSVGAYNYIWSKTFTYTVGSGGTWCSPESGYEFDGWIGNALEPYSNPQWRNGNYTGGTNPLTITLHGPVEEDAHYLFAGSDNPYTTTVAPLPPQNPGIQLPAASTQVVPASPLAPSVNQSVVFTEKNLTAGSTWSILLGTQNLSTNGPTLTFSEAPGTYAFTVTSPLEEFGQRYVRFVATPVAGTLVVGTTTVAETITFTQEVYLEIIQTPWDAGNVSTDPATGGIDQGWFVNNTAVTLYATAYFGFDYFLSLTSNTLPYVLASPSNDSVIPAFTSILNLTLSSRNITTAIAYAYVFFNETYNGEVYNGVVLMNEENSTVYYTGDGTQLDDPSDIGPFPPGTNVTFYVLAYDELGCPIRSDAYTFHTEIGQIQPVNGRTYFYVVVFDASTGEYVPGVFVNISNNTWWDITYTNSFGFAWPNASYSSNPLYLAYGWYNVTVHYAGQTQEVAYDLTPTSNKTLTFIFNSKQSAPPVYAAASDGFTLDLVFGLIVAGAVTIPIWLVWTEQRRRAAAEEKRITL